MGIHEEYKGVRRNMVSEAIQTYLIKLRNPSLLATSDTVLAKFLLKARAALSFYKWSEVKWSDVAAEHFYVTDLI